MRAAAPPPAPAARRVLHALTLLGGILFGLLLLSGTARAADTAGATTSTTSTTATGTGTGTDAGTSNAATTVTPGPATGGLLSTVSTVVAPAAHTRPVRPGQQDQQQDPAGHAQADQHTGQTPPAGPSVPAGSVSRPRPLASTAGSVTSAAGGVVTRLTGSVLTGSVLTGQGAAAPTAAGSAAAGPAVTGVPAAAGASAAGTPDRAVRPASALDATLGGVVTPLVRPAVHELAGVVGPLTPLASVVTEPLADAGHDPVGSLAGSLGIPAVAMLAEPVTDALDPQAAALAGPGPAGPPPCPAAHQTAPPDQATPPAPHGAYAGRTQWTSTRWINPVGPVANAGLAHRDPPRPARPARPLRPTPPGQPAPLPTTPSVPPAPANGSTSGGGTCFGASCVVAVLSHLPDGYQATDLGRGPADTAFPPRERADEPSTSPD